MPPKLSRAAKRLPSSPVTDASISPTSHAQPLPSRFESLSIRRVFRNTNRTFLTTTPTSTSSSSSPQTSSPFSENPPQLSLPAPRVATTNLNHPNPAFVVSSFSEPGFSMCVDTSGSGQGVRTRKQNQDAYAVEMMPNGVVCVGVYDGHGAFGTNISQTSRDVITSHVKRINAKENDKPDDFRKFVVKSLISAFVDAEKSAKNCGVDHRYSGTTATCLYIYHNLLFCACAGDSRAVMMSLNDQTIAELSWDQKPTRDDEKRRLRHAGARVARWKKNVGPQRVWLPNEWLPGLAMTRSIGDTVLSKYGVIPTPEVTLTKLAQNQYIIIAASDGVWEFMSSKDACMFVKEKLDAGESDLAQLLVEEAVTRWAGEGGVVDDTTAIVMVVDGRRMQAVEGSVKKWRKGKASRAERMLSDVPYLINKNGTMTEFEPQNQLFV